MLTSLILAEEMPAQTRWRGAYYHAKQRAWIKCETIPEQRITQLHEYVHHIASIIFTAPAHMMDDLFNEGLCESVPHQIALRDDSLAAITIADRLDYLHGAYAWVCGQLGVKPAHGVAAHQIPARSELPYALGSAFFALLEQRHGVSVYRRLQKEEIKPKEW